ncbi:MAG: hypothetical protein ABIX28_23130 [Vicinamibacterales bacterium]
MKRAIFVLSFALAAVTGAAADQKRGHKPEQAAKHGKAADHRVSNAAAIRFSTGEAGVIREQYGQQFKALPPGLQKKVARGGQLPPGWEKKIQPFPVALERRLSTLPADYGRGVIDGNAVIYHLRSHVVIDVTVLF